MRLRKNRVKMSLYGWPMEACEVCGREEHAVHRHPHNPMGGLCSNCLVGVIAGTVVCKEPTTDWSTP